jgi:hypothetical protein
MSSRAPVGRSARRSRGAWPLGSDAARAGVERRRENSPSCHPWRLSASLWLGRSTGCTISQSPPPNPHLVTTPTHLVSIQIRGYKELVEEARMGGSERVMRSAAIFHAQPNVPISRNTRTKVEQCTQRRVVGYAIDAGEDGLGRDAEVPGKVGDVLPGTHRHWKNPSDRRRRMSPRRTPLRVSAARAERTYRLSEARNPGGELLRTGDTSSRSPLT